MDSSHRWINPGRVFTEMGSTNWEGGYVCGKIKDKSWTLPINSYQKPKKIRN